jgi:hypothetical protein
VCKCLKNIGLVFPQEMLHEISIFDLSNIRKF